MTFEQVLIGVVLLSAAGRWPGSAAAGGRGEAPGPAASVQVRALEESLETARGELLLAQMRLARADAILAYSTQYAIAADVAAAVFDIALVEAVDPDLAFRLVKVESNFVADATSAAGAVGYTQILPRTARLYEPGLTLAQLYDRRTNLHLGFRFLRDMLDRHEGTPETRLRLALLSYNRGPGRVQQLLDAGQDPQNGYAATIMDGYSVSRGTPALKP